MKVKQITTCLLFTALTWLLASIVGRSFNPFEWSSSEGRVCFGFVVFAIWAVPTILEYLDPNNKS